MPQSLIVISLQILYTLGALGLAIYGLQALILTCLRILLDRKRLPSAYQVHAESSQPAIAWPTVTVQLPVFNELHVIRRLIDACARLDYPKHLLQIQILDDSTDGTTIAAERRASFWRARDVDVQLLHRQDRTGYKAGALLAGLSQARGTFIAIFDADFVPPADFLRRVLPPLLAESASTRPDPAQRQDHQPAASSDTGDKPIGFVQSRWAHLNADYSALTKAQALALDGHFVVEQAGRVGVGLPFGFNGSAGVWRRACIEDSAVGGWATDTLCEDLDLSYRAQLAGWRGVYLDQVEAPAEIPPQLLAFKRQQFRWARGSIETLRKLGGRVWQANWPLPTRIASLVHLGSYLIHPLLLLLLLVTPILLVVGVQPYWPLAYLSLVSIGPPALYAVAQRWLHPRGWLERWANLPVLTLLGMGLSLSNTVAAYQAFFGNKRVFLRTPKFHVEARADSWHASGYTLGLEPVLFGELLLASYAGLGVAIAISRGQWWNVPFLALYAAGYATVAGLGLYQEWEARSFGPGKSNAGPARVKNLVKFWGR